MSKLDKLRELIKSEKNKKNNNAGYKNDYYPFWDIKQDEQVRVRLLPDLNEENPYQFYVELYTHTLNINGKKKTTPCLYNMWGEKCPICELSKAYYDEEGKKSPNGKKYWRDKAALLRAVVITDPLPPSPETGETYLNKIVTLKFNHQLMTKLKEDMLSDELEDDVYSLTNGYDFRIKKTKNGEYDEYNAASAFVRKPTALPKTITDNLELIDLSTLLPKKVSYDDTKKLLDAHLNGTDLPSDDEKASDDEKPVDNKQNTLSSNSNDSVGSKQAEEQPENESNSDNGGDEDGDILAMIRKRNQERKKAAENK